MAGWQSGHAAACKAVYAGSIPTSASIAKIEKAPLWRFFFVQLRVSNLLLSLQDAGWHYVEDGFQGE